MVLRPRLSYYAGVHTFLLPKKTVLASKTPAKMGLVIHLCIRKEVVELHFRIKSCTRNVSGLKSINFSTKTRDLDSKKLDY
jgi:hypothetical protein